MINSEKLFEVIRACQKSILAGLFLHRVDIAPLASNKQEISLVFRKDLGKEKGEKVIVIIV